jgi:hypothetical protein
MRKNFLLIAFLKQELYTNLVIIPMLIWCVTPIYKEMRDNIVTFIAIASVYTVISTAVFFLYKVIFGWKLSRLIPNKNATNRINRYLSFLPYIEGTIVIVRWMTFGSLALFTFNEFFISTPHIYLAIWLLAGISIISFITFFFIADREVELFINAGNIDFSAHKINLHRMPISVKIGIAFFSLLLFQSICIYFIFIASEKVGVRVNFQMLLIVFSVIFTSCLILCYFLVKNIRMYLNNMNNVLDTINSDEGDLRNRLKDTNRDEMGEIAKKINIFLFRLNRIIIRIKYDLEAMNGNIKKLMDSMTESKRSAASINAMAGNVKNLIFDQSASVTEVSGTIE